MDDMADHSNAYDRFIRLPEVLKITGLSASGVYRLRTYLRSLEYVKLRLTLTLREGGHASFLSQRHHQGAI